jgi:hypothetical protein
MPLLLIRRVPGPEETSVSALAMIRSFKKNERRLRLLRSWLTLTRNFTETPEGKGLMSVGSDRYGEATRSCLRLSSADAAAKR